MLEMESLGTLTTLATGQSTGHVEPLGAFRRISAAKTEAEIDEKVGPKLK